MPIVDGQARRNSAGNTVRNYKRPLTTKTSSMMSIKPNPPLG